MNWLALAAGILVVASFLGAIFVLVSRFRAAFPEVPGIFFAQWRRSHPWKGEIGPISTEQLIERLWQRDTYLYFHLRNRGDLEATAIFVRFTGAGFGRRWSSEVSLEVSVPAGELSIGMLQDPDPKRATIGAVDWNDARGSHTQKVRFPAVPLGSKRQLKQIKDMPKQVSRNKKVEAKRRKAVQ